MGCWSTCRDWRGAGGNVVASTDSGAGGSFEEVYRRWSRPPEKKTPGAGPAGVSFSNVSGQMTEYRLSQKGT